MLLRHKSLLSPGAQAESALPALAAAWPCSPGNIRSIALRAGTPDDHASCCGNASTTCLCRVGLVQSAHCGHSMYLQKSKLIRTISNKCTKQATEHCVVSAADVPLHDDPVSRAAAIPECARQVCAARGCRNQNYLHVKQIIWACCRHLAVAAQCKDVITPVKSCLQSSTSVWRKLNIGESLGLANSGRATWQMNTP